MVPWITGGAEEATEPGSSQTWSWLSNHDRCSLRYSRSHGALRVAAWRPWGSTSSSQGEVGTRSVARSWRGP